MKRDSKLSGVLHVLLHMAEVAQPLTSEALAKMLRTNPVVIRRTLAGLRENGLVQSEKGHGGGWQLVRPLAAVTLHDVYEALGAPGLLAIGNRPDPSGCAVEAAVNSALDETFEAAEALLLARFREVTLADLSREFHERVRGRAINHFHGEAESDA